MEPSKVLHVRNLPDGVMEKEVVLLGVPFGRVVNVLLLKQKNQAFLEMGDTTTASALVEYYGSLPATVRYGGVPKFMMRVKIIWSLTINFVMECH